MGLRPAVAAALVLLAAAAGAQERPSEEELFGAPPKPPEQGKPPAAAVEPPPPAPTASVSREREDPLTVGGMLYLRGWVFAAERQPPGAWSSAAKSQPRR